MSQIETHPVGQEWLKIWGQLEDHLRDRLEHRWWHMSDQVRNCLADTSVMGPVENSLGIQLRFELSQLIAPLPA